MHLDLVIILRQFNYGKNSFIVLIPVSPAQRAVYLGPGPRYVGRRGWRRLVLEEGHPGKKYLHLFFNSFLK